MRVASAPVSFGVDEVIADDAWIPDSNDVLTWMAELEYEGTEMGPPGYLGQPPVLRPRLETLSLEMVGAFLPLHLSHRDGVKEDGSWLAKNLVALRETAAPETRPFAVICEAIDEEVRLAWAGRIGMNPEARLDASRWPTLVDNLHRAAEICWEHGLEPVFHPHAGTYIETEEEIDQLANAMDPQLVALCLDTGHFAFGGAEPGDAAHAYASLIRHVHIKDCDTAVRDDVAARGGNLDQAVREGVFCALGAGDVGIDASLQALRDIDYQGWIVVEHDQLLSREDTPESVVAGQLTNRAYLRERGF